MVGQSIQINRSRNHDDPEKTKSGSFKKSDNGKEKLTLMQRIPSPSDQVLAKLPQPENYLRSEDHTHTSSSVSQKIPLRNQLSTEHDGLNSKNSDVTDLDIIAPMQTRNISAHHKTASKKSEDKSYQRRLKRKPQHAETLEGSFENNRHFIPAPKI